MSKQKSLAELSRQFPSPPELRETFEALRSDTDRSVAIVAASIAENVLERVIRRHLATSRRQLVDSLFANRGPMSDFNGKIVVAEAFGILSPGVASEYRLIRRIRNVFAHATLAITFATDEVATEMMKFGILNVADNVPGGRAMPRDKAGYLLVVQLICTILDHDHRKQGGEPILATWLDDPRAD